MRMVDIRRGAWREDLQTSVWSIEYDFIERRGTLRLPPLCCTDMSGCVRLFERIDPGVEAIDVTTPDEHVNTYRRLASGWTSR
jgi:hypothetical protein